MTTTNRWKRTLLAGLASLALLGLAACDDGEADDVGATETVPQVEAPAIEEGEGVETDALPEDGE